MVAGEHIYTYGINKVFFCFFANVTGVAEIFADVTASTFDDVTTVATKIFFDDVTANLNPLD